MITITCKVPGRSSPVVFKEIEAIFFDKDGTLSRSEDYLRVLGQKRAAALENLVPGCERDLLQCFGFRNDELDPEGLLPVGSGEENRLAAAGQLAKMGYSWFECLRMTANTFEEVTEDLPPFYTLAPVIPGTIEAFQRLAELPVKLAVVSGDTTPNIEKFLGYNYLLPFVDGVRGADVYPRKPDPECFWQMCAALGVKPEATVMIGDATGDMAMARAAGAAGGIGVLWGWTLTHEIEQADAIVSQWDQIEFAEQ